MNFKPTDILHYFLILLIAFIMTIFVASSAQINSTIFLPIVIVFSFLISFLINRALDRKKALSAAISVEISRLRRLHHLSEHMSTPAWRVQLDDANATYQQAVGKNFLRYSECGEQFRELSHTIYKFKPKTRYDEIMFGELLGTMREVALERQLIAERISEKLPAYGWLVVITVAIFLSILLLLGAASSVGMQIGSSFAIASVLFILDLLRSVDHISSAEKKVFEKMYQKNLVE